MILIKVLLSIKPEFADEIFKGTKKYEYRRIIFKRTDIEKVIVYATSPVSKVIGEFEIEEILHSDLQNLWDETKDFAGISEDFFFYYFHGKSLGYAIKIKSYKKYTNPQDLKTVYGIRPPQSFAYVD